MLEEFETGVNESEFAEQTQEEVTETGQVEQSAETEEVAEPQKPVQDAETNARFADIRRRTEAETRDKMIREMSNGQYNSWSEYQEALQRQQWEEQGKDPEIESLKQEMQVFKLEKTRIEQDKMLESDPEVGEFYKEWRDEVHQLANQYGWDYDVAFTFLSRQKLREVASSALKQGEQKTLQNVIDRNKKQIETTADAGHVSKIDVNSLSDNDIDDLAERALRGERIQL